MAHSGESRSPRCAVERAAAAAITAAEVSLAGESADLRKMFVLIYADSVPAGELDCTSSGRGYEDGADLMSEIFAHFAGAMKALGCEVKLVPLGQG